MTNEESHKEILVLICPWQQSSSAGAHRAPQKPAFHKMGYWGCFHKKKPISIPSLPLQLNPWSREGLPKTPSLTAVSVTCGACDPAALGDVQPSQRAQCPLTEPH